MCIRYREEPEQSTMKADTWQAPQTVYSYYASQESLAGGVFDLNETPDYATWEEMCIRDRSNPNYLGAYSIEDNKDLILTISKVQQETVTGPDGKKDECIVCYFSESEKPMILNSTNAKQIQKLLNTPYIEKWLGHKIQIGIEKVRAFGDIVDCLLYSSLEHYILVTTKG